MDRSPKAILSELFESGFEGSSAMLGPNSITSRLVNAIVKEFSLDNVIRDLGVRAANELADNIQTRALRPADFAELPELAETLSERLMQELGKDPDAFNTAFLSQLRARG